MKLFKDILVDLLYPRRCPVCDGVLPKGVGLICKKHGELAFVRQPACMKCGKELDDDTVEYCQDCRRDHRCFERGFPVFKYEEPIRSSVLNIKYKNRREYCDYYGEVMAEKLMPHLCNMRLDGLVPVPVHPHKLKTRGFNQAEILASEISKHIGIPVYKDMLVRLEDTKPQKELDDLQRFNNLNNAFAVSGSSPRLKNVMIVDDIYTTGATVHTCAKKLLEFGVQNVYVTTIAIGSGRG